MCGRGGVAGAALMTSQQVCVGSTGGRLPQGLENGLWTSSEEEDKKSKKMEAENMELRARIEALEKEGEESVMAEEWRTDMDVEEEIESRKKLDEQTRKLQKELPEIENF